MTGRVHAVSKIPYFWLPIIFDYFQWKYVPLNGGRMDSNDVRPEEVPSSLVNLTDEPHVRLTHAGSLSDEPSNTLPGSHWRLSGFLTFLADVLRDEDEARRLGVLIMQLGIASALIAVPIAALGSMMLGSVAGYCAAGIGTGSAIAIVIRVCGRLGRRKRR